MENNENNAVYPNSEEMPIGNMPKEVMQTEEQPMENIGENQPNEPTVDEIASFIREELMKLIEHYPDCGVSSFKELMTKPYAKELLHYWSRGVPLYKAYGIVNAEEIYQQRTNAERQRALNSMRSKSHLRSIGGSPRAERAVPVEVMQQYREFFPDWSDGQIIKDYQSRY